MKAFFAFLALPILAMGQPTQGAIKSDPDPAASVIPEHILQLVDSLSAVNQIHGPYVGFDGETTSQYQNFKKLSELACTDELLELTNHDNAVVRGYAFWALARQQYEGLDSVLLAHAHDEDPVREIQGGIINSVPLIDFMQWVVDPEMLDEDSRKLEPEIFQRVSQLRFADR